MSLIVQKFGGSSVANAERVFNVARIVTDTYKKGNSVVVVVSAQGDTTDDLIAKAEEINPNASKGNAICFYRLANKFRFPCLPWRLKNLAVLSFPCLAGRPDFRRPPHIRTRGLNGLKRSAYSAQLTKQYCYRRGLSGTRPLQRCYDAWPGRF